MSNKARSSLIYLGLAGFSFLQVLLFAAKGLPVIPDIVRFHLNYIASFAAAQSFADPLPRWLPDLNAGYGSPTFVFYGPLPYFLASVLFKITSSLRISMIITAWIAVSIGTISVYGILNRFFSTGLALAGAALFAVRFHTVAILSALGTTWATNLIPFVLYGMFLWLESLDEESLTRHQERVFAGLVLAFALGLFLMTHAISILLFGVFLAFTALVFLVISRSVKTLFTIVPVIGGVSVATVYLLPLIALKDFVQSDYAATDVQVSKMVFDSLFDLPVIDVFLFAAGIFLPVWNLRCLGHAAAKGQMATGLTRNLWVSLMIGTVVWTIFAFLMQFQFSLPIWNSHQLIQNLQYPERLIPLLEVLVYLSLIPAVRNLYLLHAGFARVADALAKRRYAFYALLVIGGLSFYYSHMRFKTEGYLSKDESNPITYPIEGSPIRSLADAGQYRPHGIPIKTNYFDFEATSQPIRFARSTGQVTIDSPQGHSVSVHQFYFPGWVAWTAEGKDLPVTGDERGLVAVQVPVGVTSFYLKPLARGIVPLSNWISAIVGLLLLMGLVLTFKFRKKPVL
ncbi:MAG: hypothetical protein JNM27_12230 [Leptospirales bacterium]|nr:hypothetical protein [Leptospirales bacterium]